MDDQICRLVWLKPGAAETYDRLHREAPPEIRERLRRGGVRDYSIFRHADLLISVLRRDPNRTPPSINPEVEARWRASLDPLFARTVDENGEHIRAQRVFRLE